MVTYGLCLLGAAPWHDGVGVVLSMSPISRRGVDGGRNRELAWRDALMEEAGDPLSAVRVMLELEEV